MTDAAAPREICVAIDPWGIRLGSLEIAVLIAERLNAGLRGLLVGDQLLHQVAQLPFTTEVLVHTGEERNLAQESLTSSQHKNLQLIAKMLEQATRARQVSFRLEVDRDILPLGVLLRQQQDLFLPARRRPATPPRKLGGIRQLPAVKWVYDGSPASQHCLALLEQLIAAGITRTVYLIGQRAVPSQVLADLSARGARVCWVNCGAGLDILRQLTRGPEADLILLPASFSELIGDARVEDINRFSSCPMLVVG